MAYRAPRVCFLGFEAAERILCVDVDFDGVIVDRTFEQTFTGSLDEETRAAVPFKMSDRIEQGASDQNRIAAQAGAHWRYRVRRFDRGFECLDQAIYEGA